MAPRVSIGLPVYNGRKYLHEAIDSILGQTYEDFELLLFDNASTDSTEAICRGYAKADSRVRYVRNDRNIGAAPNFNRSFHHAAGEYFKWAAADDVCAPRFVERCVEVLDRDPSAILSYSKVAVIDERGRHLKDYDFMLDGAANPPARRFGRQITGHQCYEIFGLFRASALRKTPLIGTFAGGDAALLLELCLRGRFIEIPEVLFYSRAHPEQSTALRRNARTFAAWFDPRWKGKIIFPYWRLLNEYIRIVHNAPLRGGERLACYLHVATWTRHRLLHLTRDLSAGVGLALATRGKAPAVARKHG
jgi:glycosyltransferase involved in cell wall biosynthesis